MSPKPEEFTSILRDALNKRLAIGIKTAQEEGIRAFENSDSKQASMSADSLLKLTTDRSELNAAMSALDRVLFERFGNVDIPAEEFRKLLGLPEVRQEINIVEVHQPTESKTDLPVRKKEVKQEDKSHTVHALRMWLEKDAYGGFAYDRRDIAKYLAETDGANSSEAKNRFSNMKNAFGGKIKDTGARNVGEACKVYLRDNKVEGEWLNVFDTASHLYGKLTPVELINDVINRREDSDDVKRGRRPEIVLKPEDLQNELTKTPLTELLLGNALSISDVLLSLDGVNHNIIDEVTQPGSDFTNRIDGSRVLACDARINALPGKIATEITKAEDGKARDLIPNVINSMIKNPEKWNGFYKSTKYESWKFIFRLINETPTANMPDAKGLCALLFPTIKVTIDTAGFVQ